jgi:hypothetical protein
VTDWRAVLALADKHRVEGLVANAMISVAELPAFVAAEARRTADEVKGRALGDVAETLRVSDALQSRGIGHAILKGAPLGVRAFGSPLLKQSWDIDVFVDTHSAVAGAAALADVGYTAHVPARPFTPAEFRRWSTVSKEAEFRSASGRTVELHWSLSDHPMLLRGLNAGAVTEEVELFAGQCVPTLGDAANIAYLAVHGAFHGWSRLKWLADFAAFVGSHPGERQEQLIAEARDWNVGLALDQALALANEVLSAGLRSAPRANAQILIRLAKTTIERRGEAQEFDRDRRASDAISQIKRRLHPGTRYRLMLLYRRLRGTEDRRQFPLPNGLTWAYWLLRPFGGSWRVLQRRLASRDN